ncbi:hypothetical protein DPMN_030825 [Dreissena polymorpha]|uniref:Uncharacterized protein n=1 Tax=Dreissena polymorpha TaxID=45954 RepID=A0A9D4RIF8_DREPO|nr:hypothetical protein DPMN_030825 [Dreissena polymorpha]
MKDNQNSVEGIYLTTRGEERLWKWIWAFQQCFNVPEVMVWVLNVLGGIWNSVVNGLRCEWDLTKIAIRFGNIFVNIFLE